MRGSFVVLGPLWARRGFGKVSYPGGCLLGHRPVDLHLKGLESLGAEIRIDGGNVTASGPVGSGWVYLCGPYGSTVLGTANVVMAATLGRGTSYIEAAAMEPEIVDLCNFLNACGARISGIGSHLLVVEAHRGRTKIRHHSALAAGNGVGRRDLGFQGSSSPGN